MRYRIMETEQGKKPGSVLKQNTQGTTLVQNSASSKLQTDLMAAQAGLGNRYVQRVVDRLKAEQDDSELKQPAQPDLKDSERENRTGLPDQLKLGVEQLSGYSLDDVRVHYNSPKPAGLQALAYTQGTVIHIAPGQEQHLPHEAWHVVQQVQGRVKPILQFNDGIQVNDDLELEHEADVMGKMALQKLHQTRGFTTGQAWTAHELTHVVQRYSLSPGSKKGLKERCWVETDAINSIAFTQFTSCIGLVGLNEEGTRIRGVHLVMSVGGQPGTSLEPADADLAGQVAKLFEGYKDILMFGSIDAWDSDPGVQDFWTNLKRQLTIKEMYNWGDGSYELRRRDKSWETVEEEDKTAENGKDFPTIVQRMTINPKRISTFDEKYPGHNHLHEGVDQAWETDELEIIGKLIENFFKRTDFEYAAGKSGGTGIWRHKGDCETLRDEFIKLASECYGIEVTKGNVSDKNILIRGGAMIIDNKNKRGNVDGGAHWFFGSHSWAVWKDRPIDVLFGQLGVVGHELGKIVKDKVGLWSEYYEFSDLKIYRNKEAKTESETWTTDASKRW